MGKPSLPCVIGIHTQYCRRECLVKVHTVVRTVASIPSKTSSFRRIRSVMACLSCRRKRCLKLTLGSRRCLDVVSRRCDERRRNGWWEMVLKEAPKWRVSDQEAPKWQPSDRFFVLKDRHFLETELSETRKSNRNFVVVVFSFLANHCGASIFFATFRLL
jgi:hypothetical protein